MSYHPWLLRRRGARLLRPLCVGVAGSLLIVAAFGAEPPVEETSTPEAVASFLIPAYAYDRGKNVEVCTTRYADAGPMIGNRRYPTARSMAAKSRSMSSGRPVEIRRWFGEWP